MFFLRDNAAVGTTIGIDLPIEFGGYSVLRGHSNLSRRLSFSYGIKASAHTGTSRTLVIDLANFVASIYENDGGIMLDDVTDLAVSLHFANIIYQSFINSTNGQELQYSFDLLKAAALVSLQCDVPIIEGKNKLKKYKNKVSKISEEIKKNCSFSNLLLESTESAQDKRVTLTNSDIVEQFGVISQYGITTAIDQAASKSTSSAVNWTTSTSSSSNYLSIPSNKNGYYIIEIAKEGYKGYTGNTIAIPDSIQVIGQEAFSDCKNLQTIVIYYLPPRCLYILFLLIIVTGISMCTFPVQNRLNSSFLQENTALLLFVNSIPIFVHSKQLLFSPFCLPR